METIDIKKALTQVIFKDLTPANVARLFRSLESIKTSSKQEAIVRSRRYIVDPSDENINDFLRLYNWKKSIRYSLARIRKLSGRPDVIDIVLPVEKLMESYLLSCGYDASNGCAVQCAVEHASGIILFDYDPDDPEQPDELVPVFEELIYTVSRDIIIHIGIKLDRNGEFIYLREPV